MDARTLAIDCGMLALVFAGYGYGYAFLKRGNFLLGAEWLILGFSASNMFLYFNALNSRSEAITWTCDAFSRGIGIPVIALMGFMQITHAYKPSVLADVVLFVGGFLLAIVVLDAKALEPILPYIYLIGGMPWVAYQFYFARRLQKAGHTGLGAAVAGLVVWVTGVGMLEGIVAIPGDETNVFLNFFFIAHWSWAIYFTVLYYAYVALEESLVPTGTLSGSRVAAHA